MPTSDEDWHRLIDGDEPDRPLRAGADAWLVFEAFVSMESAKAAHEAIRQADAMTVRQALLAAVVSRRATPMAPAERVAWLKRDANAVDLIHLFDFAPHGQSDDA
jgi:hypothetical protein